MRALVAAVLTLLGAVVRAGEVIVLREPLFDALTEAGNPSASTTWFVKFYAPWCSHCTAMAPELESLAEQMSERTVRIAKVDAEKESTLATKYKIAQYPTLLVFHNGEVYQYRGKRRAENMMSALMDMVNGEIPTTIRRVRLDSTANANGGSFWDDMDPFLLLISVVVGGALGGGVVWLVFRPRGSEEEFAKEVDKMLDEVDKEWKKKKSAKQSKAEEEKSNEKESKKDK